MLSYEAGCSLTRAHDINTGVTYSDSKKEKQKTVCLHSTIIIESFSPRVIMAPDVEIPERLITPVSFSSSGGAKFVGIIVKGSR